MQSIHFELRVTESHVSPKGRMAGGMAAMAFDKSALVDISIDPKKVKAGRIFDMDKIGQGFLYPIHFKSCDSTLESCRYRTPVVLLAQVFMT